MAEKKNRIYWIDIAKGIGILLVCMGHYAYDDLLGWLCQFHMPLFFLASGYCYSAGNKTLKQELAHKAYGLLVLFFSFSFLKWVLTVGWDLLHGIWRFHGDLLLAPILCIPNTPYFSKVWFFQALFVANVIFCLMLRGLKAVHARHLPEMQLLVSLTICIGSWVLFNGRTIPFEPWIPAEGGRMWLPWQADISMYMLPFLSAGYWLRRRGIIDKVLSRGKAVSWAATAGLFILSVVFSLYVLQWDQNQINFFIRGFANPGVMLAGGLLGSLFVFMLSACIGRCEPLEYIGRNSAIFYLLQWRVAGVVANLVFRIFNIIPMWQFLTIVAGVSALIVWPMCVVLNFFFPFFLGKGRRRRQQ